MLRILVHKWQSVGTSMRNITLERNDMNNIRKNKPSFLVLAVVVSLILGQPLSAELAQKRVLIINSDKSVGKYATIHKEFESELSVKAFEIDLRGENLNPRTLKQKVSKVRPHLVYTIGSKAYLQATAIIKDKPLIFSSMINWRRFPIEGNIYGIALELSTEMPLYMYSYLFPKIRTLGVLYSKRHNQQWFDNAVSQAEEVGIRLYGKSIEAPSELTGALNHLLSKVDAIWLISDPMVLYNATHVQQIFAKSAAKQKPIFAYNTLFSKYGAVLTIAADIPTMGRQAAGLVLDILEQQSIDERVQFPAGSHSILNLKKVYEYGLKINHSALSSVEEIIE